MGCRAGKTGQWWQKARTFRQILTVVDVVESVVVVAFVVVVGDFVVVVWKCE